MKTGGWLKERLKTKTTHPAMPDIPRFHFENYNFCQCSKWNMISMWQLTLADDCTKLIVLFADESRSNLGAETTEVNMMLYEVLACGLCYSDTNMLSGRDCCGSVQLGSPAGAALPAAPRSSYCAIRACLHNDNNNSSFSHDDAFSGTNCHFSY